MDGFVKILPEDIVAANGWDNTKNIVISDFLLKSLMKRIVVVETELERYHTETRVLRLALNFHRIILDTFSDLYNNFVKYTAREHIKSN